jgi:hypothetical protein
MIVLGLSKSMAETDLPPDRLDTAKHGLHDFVAGLPHDRIGVVSSARSRSCWHPRRDAATRSRRDDRGDQDRRVPELGTADAMPSRSRSTS